MCRLMSPILAALLVRRKIDLEWWASETIRVNVRLPMKASLCSGSFLPIRCVQFVLSFQCGYEITMWLLQTTHRTHSSEGDNLYHAHWIFSDLRGNN